MDGLYIVAFADGEKWIRHWPESVRGDVTTPNASYNYINRTKESKHSHKVLDPLSYVWLSPCPPVPSADDRNLRFRQSKCPKDITKWIAGY
jgi:hypothetical protein